MAPPSAPHADLFRRFDEILQRRPPEAPSEEPPTEEGDGADVPPSAPLLRSLRADRGEDEGEEERRRAEDTVFAQHAIGAWLGEWSELQREAREVEDEVTAELAKLKPRMPAPQAELELERGFADDNSRRWHQLSQPPPEAVAVLAQNVEQVRNGGAVEGHLRAVARGIERELDVFKVQQRQEFEALAKDDADLQ
eukprot:CAMPEP_0176084168 /NCGR_PEP_ID=MMETSP0120_2-20121206/42117_1 /TAXON_ID=160619 /ORGANISM="Kryptoperidinium foliaceum, Strain CCMP 1326" /LENGTH=194 /DNA_ID=CAMNT_0017417967 /DNA_START=33 /DNA_END=615 /DNA_ORIENTATION=+